MSEYSKVIVVLAGTSYIGQLLVHTLVQRGYSVRVPTRNPQNFTHLTMGGAYLVRCDIQDEQQLASVLDGAHTVVNALDFKHQKSAKRYLHNIKNVSNFCQKKSIQHFIHLVPASCSVSKHLNWYSRDHASAERQLMALRKMQVTIIRFSWLVGKSIFGAPVDNLTRLMQLLRSSKSVGVYGPCARVSLLDVSELVGLLVQKISQIPVDGVSRIIARGGQSMMLLDVLRVIKQQLDLPVALRPANYFERSWYSKVGGGTSFLFPQGLTDYEINNIVADGSDNIKYTEIFEGKHHLDLLIRQLSIGVDGYSALRLMGSLY